MRDINLIVVHSTATPPSMDVTVKLIDEWHRARGFKSCGYHFLIKRDSSLNFGRDVREVGAHTKGYNKHSIGIALEGGLNKDQKPESNFILGQLIELNRLCLFLKERHAIQEICGHRDIPGTSTECPGFNVKELLKNANLV